MKHYGIILKDILVEIWKTRSRFLSIFTIIAIGAGFFAGVKSTCPDMKSSMQRYYADTRLMDAHLKSTMGFTDDDVAALRQLDGVETAESAYMADVFADAGNGANIIARLYSFDREKMTSQNDFISRPVLKEGRFPETTGECLAEGNKLSQAYFTLGTTVTLRHEDGDISDTLKSDSYTVVGVVESPMYISLDRGNSSIGDGSIGCFLYLPKEDFRYEFYTDLFLRCSNTESLSFDSDAYEKLMETNMEALKDFGSGRAEIRCDDLKKTAAGQLSDAERRLDDGIAEYDQNRKAFDDAMSAARKQLDAAAAEIRSNEKKLSDGKAALEEGQKQYEAGLVQLKASEALLSESERRLNDGEQQLERLEQLTAGAGQLAAAFADRYLPAGAALPEEAAAVISGASAVGGFLDGAGDLGQMLTDYIYTDPEDTAQKSALKGGLTQGLAAVEDGLGGQRTELAKGRAELEAGRQTVSQGFAALAASKSRLDRSTDELRTGEAKLQSGKTGYEKGEAEYLRNKAEGEAKLAEAAQKIADGQKELEDGRAALADLKAPVWYVLDRSSNPGYGEFEQDAERVDKIAGVLPIFFVLVAALVCLTTMTRMVEEQRTQIGTLKALGYSRGAIFAKFILYAVLASFFGSLLGLSIGFRVIPAVIFNAYRTLYSMPPLSTPFRWDYAALCTLAALACTVLTAIFSCYRELASAPAELMRPRAPQAGKRVLLEKVSFIWSRLSFLHKVTVRNLFRFKKRIYMTIVGIAGCTALLLAGFGMQYAISSIVEKQYGEIFTYNLMGFFDEKISGEKLDALGAQLSADQLLTGHLFLRQNETEVSSEKVRKNIYLVVPEDREQLARYIRFQKRADKSPVPFPERGAVITEKLSKLLSLKEGELITLHKGDGSSVEVPVSGITENYTMNYIYLSKTEYEESFGQPLILNSFLADMADVSEENAVSTGFLQNDAIQSLNFTAGDGARFRDTVHSLNYIVLVIIFSAGALAFVVLYNLANINVHERIREVATIKVLGFYDREVSAYIIRENTIAALIGMAAGLILGIPFERFVITTAEVDLVMFNPGINLLSFVFAAALTMAFTLLVNLALHFSLKKVDMVESLKSVE